MKTGILTFHAAHNYGAVLQAYALQEYLKKLGHEVEVIDYRPEYLIRGYTVFLFPRLRGVPLPRKIGGCAFRGASPKLPREFAAAPALRNSFRKSCSFRASVSRRAAAFPRKITTRSFSAAIRFGRRIIRTAAIPFSSAISPRLRERSKSLTRRARERLPPSSARIRFSPAR